jgi:hypothetical protein
VTPSSSATPTPSSCSVTAPGSVGDDADRVRFGGEPRRGRTPPGLIVRALGGESDQSSALVAVRRSSGLRTCPTHMSGIRTPKAITLRNLVALSWQDSWLWRRACCPARFSQVSSTWSRADVPSGSSCCARTAKRTTPSRTVSSKPRCDVRADPVPARHLLAPTLRLCARGGDVTATWCSALPELTRCDRPRRLRVSVSPNTAKCQHGISAGSASDDRSTSGLAALVVALTETSKLARLSPSLITSNLGRGSGSVRLGRGSGWHPACAPRPG